MVELIKAIDLNDPKNMLPTFFAPQLLAFDVSPATTSPLTIPNEAETVRTEGFTATKEGIRGCYHHFFRLRDNPEFPHLKALLHSSNLEVLPEDWKKEGREPVTDVERAQEGQLWSYEDFETLGILGGGSFGRVVLLRNKARKDIRVVVKIEAFSVEDFYTYFCRELLAGSAVQHANIARYVT